MTALVEGSGGDTAAGSSAVCAAAASTSVDPFGVTLVPIARQPNKLSAEVQQPSNMHGSTCCDSIWSGHKLLDAAKSDSNMQAVN